MLQNAEYLAPGIMVYRNTFTKELNLIDRLENAIGGETVKKYKWNQASTGYSHTDLSYRDCFDFKIKVNSDESLMANNEYVPQGTFSESDKQLAEIYQDAFRPQIDPVNDYRIMFNIAPLNYWESFNFVKYGPGQHFQIHSDHGYSYICVLSSVGYLNDDYEGGELFFDKFNLKIKPKAGDLYLFPSSFLFSHQAMPVKEGTKYSIVTMLDYLEAPHTPDYFDIESRYSKGLL